MIFIELLMLKLFLKWFVLTFGTAKVLFLLKLAAVLLIVVAIYIVCDGDDQKYL